jgi:hypothetical protein
MAAVVPVPPEHAGTVATLTDHPMYRRTFSGLPWEVGLVELDSLVAGQRAVNLDYADSLVALYQSMTTFDDVARVSIAHERQMDAVQHLEVAPSVHTFSSPNGDLRFLGAFLKRELQPSDLDAAELGGIPVAAVIAFVGYGGSPINVFRVGGRTVLNNGFHRLYALRRIGFAYIPAVVQTVMTPQLEMPPQIADLPREVLLGSPRPPLLKDFFEPGFTTRLKVTERLKSVTVAVNAQQMPIPS